MFTFVSAIEHTPSLTSLTEADGRCPSEIPLRVRSVVSDLTGKQRGSPSGPEPTQPLDVDPGHVVDIGHVVDDVAGWQESALCRGVGADLFFPAGTVGPEAVEQGRRAAAVCRMCAVREPCLEFSLATNQEFGVWGGLTEDQRHPLRQARRQRAKRTGAASAEPRGAAG